MFEGSNIGVLNNRGNLEAPQESCLEISNGTPERIRTTDTGCQE